MRKLIDNAPDAPPRRRSSRTANVLAVAFVLLISPVLYDATSLCIAQWKGLFGVIASPPTPVLDAIGSCWDGACLDLQSRVHLVFHSGEWKSSYVFPFAILWTGALALALRKG